MKVVVGIWGLQRFTFRTSTTSFPHSLTNPLLKISLPVQFIACSLNRNHLSNVFLTRWLHVIMRSSLVWQEGEHVCLCYLVWVRGFCVDLPKSLMITSSLPSLRTQRWTTRRTFSNLRSSARRWGSVKIGRKGSSSRDSLIISLSLNCGRARSWSRTSVELLILRKGDEWVQDAQWKI